MSTERQPAAGQQGAKTSLMTFAFRQAFDLLAETTAAAAVEESRGAKLSTGHPVWLGFLEAFRTFCLAPPAELRALMKEIGVATDAAGQVRSRSRVAYVR